MSEAVPWTPWTTSGAIQRGVPLKEQPEEEEESEEEESEEEEEERNRNR